MSGQQEQHTDHYDPELPFLYELELELRHRAERAAYTAGHTRGAAAPVHARRTRGPMRPMPMRVARRSLTLVALLCLIGASAYGANQVFSGGTSNPTVVHQSAFALVATGHAGSDAWSLRLYTRGGDLCRVLVVSEDESSRCAPSPGARTLSVTGLVSPLRQYVYGVTGGRIARVIVRAGGATATVATHAPASVQAHAAGLRGATRWFIAVLPRPAGDADPPALVQGLDAAGHRTGPARVACAQTAQPQVCPS